MLKDFKVRCKFTRCYIRFEFVSYVYAIDYKNDKFLVADEDGEFWWVTFDECNLVPNYQEACCLG